MTDVITATTAPAFVMKESHNDHNGNGHNGYGWGMDGFHGYNTRDTVNHNDQDLSRQIGSLESGLLSAVYKNTFDLSVGVEKGNAANQLATEKVGAATNLAIASVAFDAQIEAVKNAAALNLAVEKTAAAAALFAQQVAAANAAAIAACCCEMKELVREDGGKTRDLISALNLKNIQDQLSQAQLVIAIANRRPLIPGI